MNASPHQPYRAKSGAILIIVLWISTGLVTVSLLFGQSMMLSYRAGDNTLSGIQAEHAIEGALHYIKYALRNGDYGEFDPEESFRAELVSVGDARFWLLGRSEEERTDMYEYPAFGLVDEASKLNLNTATIEMLEQLPDMTPEFAAAIIDWRDEDDELTENGAESETYLIRQPAYEAKNAPFDTVDELLLVQYAEWDYVFAEDTNLNGFLDPNEQDGEVSLPIDDQDRTLQSGIIDFVTVYSRQSNLDENGEQKINVNGDNSEELTQLLEETLGAERAAELSIAAGGAEYTSMLQFYNQSGLTAEEFAQINQAICLSDEPYTEGLVNINTARYEVLVCLPGMDEDKARQIVNYRNANPDALTSVAWVAEVLDEDTMNELGEYITAQAYQYTTDIAAVGNDGKGYRRVKYIIDTGGGTPVVRYRKDMTRMGWALGEVIREEQRQLKESGNEVISAIRS